MSNFIYFNNFRNTQRITREPIELQRRGRSHSIPLLQAYLKNVLRFDLRSTDQPLEGKLQKQPYLRKKSFSVIAFDSNKSRHQFYQHRVTLVEKRRMNYKLTWKGHFENLTSGQGHDLTGKSHVAYHSIRIVELNTSDMYIVKHLTCYHRSSTSL